jgi:hypothetical protein
MNKLFLLILLFAFSNVFSQGNAKVAVPDSIAKIVRTQLVKISEGGYSKVSKTVQIHSYPLFVECYSDKSKGDSLEKKQIQEFSESIFGAEFISEINTILMDSTKFSACFVFKENKWNFAISANYLRQSDMPGFKDEYSRLFRFYLIENQMKLVFVYCAG